MPKLKVLDLFSGIGGFSLGLERAGMETAAFCEIKPFPRRVLEKHWPNVKCYQDVKTLTKERLSNDGIKAIDVICGGFPCQDLSIAGQKAGFQGERSSLYREVLRLISELGPRFTIFENVANLISGDGGRWFSVFLNDLAKIGQDAEWHCIPASCVGANHHRDRVWVVAYPQGNSIKGSIFQGFPRAELFKGKPRGSAWGPVSGTHWEEDQPQFTQMDDGISNWVGDVSGYGNAVVPQIPEIIGRAIIAVDKGVDK